MTPKQAEILKNLIVELVFAATDGGTKLTQSSFSNNGAALLEWEALNNFITNYPEKPAAPHIEVPVDDVAYLIPIAPVDPKILGLSTAKGDFNEPCYIKGIRTSDFKKGNLIYLRVPGKYPRHHKCTFIKYERGLITGKVIGVPEAWMHRLLGMEIRVRASNAYLWEGNPGCCHWFNSKGECI